MTAVLMISLVFVGTLAGSESPTLSVTLVPPSPVTNQVVLDVRGAVSNPSAEPRDFEAAFYLDETVEDKRLHGESVMVAPGAKAGLRFRVPTERWRGTHRVVLQVREGGASWTESRSVEVRPSEVRSTGRIDGTWVEFYHWSEREGRPWNESVKEMTDAQWAEQVRGMAELGMNVVVLEESFRNQVYVGKHRMEQRGYHGRAYYPSERYPERMPIAAVDPIEAVLAEADRRDMYVFIPVGMYAWFDFTRGSLEWHQRVMAELYARYGHHRSFYGWYIPEEIQGNLGNTPERWTEIVTFFRELKAFARGVAPDKPIMLASNCHQVPQAAAVYPELLQHLDILCPFGFHRMPEGDLSGDAAAAMLQQWCDAAGAHLWMDMELFVFGPDRALLPRPIEAVTADLARYPTFEKVLAYQYTGLMNAPWATRKPGGDATVALFEAYRDWLREQR